MNKFAPVIFIGGFDAGGEESYCKLDVSASFAHEEELRNSVVENNSLGFRGESVPPMGRKL